MRNSEYPDGPVLRLTRAQWVGFMAGLRAGDFD